MAIDAVIDVSTSVPTLNSSLDETPSVSHKKLHYESFFCPAQQENPFDLVRWKIVDVVQLNAKKEIIFEQKGVEAPEDWSERAISIVTQKYFRGKLGTPEREHSIRQIVTRVVDTIWNWAIQQEYFETLEDSTRFRNDLVYLLLTQRGAFNSPVWFNLGVPGVEQQVSACFILSVEDTLESIAQLQTNEALIFKRGSGTGVNFSKLRSRKEYLSGGGLASGPISFMRGLDSWAGIIKSGGTTRRAAKLSSLNIDHPDIMEFIKSKRVEEEKARKLIDAGYSSNFDDPKGAYASVFFQNGNHSVRVTDEFMQAVQHAYDHPKDENLWNLHSVKTGEVLERVPVMTLWEAICNSIYDCGDPGIQFDTTINKWNTCVSGGRIESSNACGEVHFLDDTSCNLASLNLMKFQREDGWIDEKTFCRAVDVFTIAQDILVDPAFYPTEQIGEQTRKYRPLGLGYTNLGAFLMTAGDSYDSAASRTRAAYITSLMTAQAYLTSTQLAASLGPFEAYTQNRNSMLAVIDQHLAAAEKEHATSPVRALWQQVRNMGERHGFRNAQATVLAPTGTISFLMDADTTGCEPEMSLYKVKNLVGGGAVLLENRVVDLALQGLGYSQTMRAVLLGHLAHNQTMEGAPGLKTEHLAVFDCAIPGAGTRSLSIAAHLEMTAALQPFISGAISKTMNLPKEATVDEISLALMRAWELGIKNITIYRNECKKTQPIVTKKAVPVSTTSTASTASVSPQNTTTRKKLRDHQNNTHRIKFEFAAIKGYILSTPFEDTGMPGEIFVELSKEGATVSGLVKGWATLFSYALQAGIPLQKLVDKFSHTKFEPAGFSPDPDIRFASSMYDAIVRKLAAVFLTREEPVDIRPAHSPYNGVHQTSPLKTALSTTVETPMAPPVIPYDEPKFDDMDTPLCSVCGSLTRRVGANCYTCTTCPAASGCG